LAEQRFGVLRGVDDCAYLTWSTGIGFGLMCDGRLLRGKRGNAGHAGHAVAVAPLASDPVCGCGNVGDLESLAGGAALARAWGDSPESLCAAARRGEHRARALLDRALDAVSAALYNLIVTLDLERIAVGGGLFCAQRDLLLEPLRERVFADPRRCGLSTMLESVRIEPVADPARTAELGALCIVMPADWAPSGFRH
ncbi:MAG: ROK family protein, partial [Actinobacteria bacterium]|nr:ROK family protein [Actinomycetota bacterium]